MPTNLGGRIDHVGGIAHVDRAVAMNKKYLFYQILALVLFCTFGFLIARDIKNLNLDILSQQQAFLQSQDLFHIESGRHTPCEHFWINKWRSYAKHIVHLAPQIGEANSLIGFFLLLEGNDQEAKKYYLKAQAANPVFWANHYNLGLIALKNKDYSEAIEYFKKAAGCTPELYAMTFQSSRVYQDLIAKAKGMNINLEQRFQIAQVKIMQALQSAAAENSSAGILPALF